jgi:hypothetical protein
VPDRPIILKATRDKDYDAAAPAGFDSGLAREWIATAFLTERLGDERHAPVFLAGDRARWPEAVPLALYPVFVPQKYQDSGTAPTPMA